MYVVCTYTYTPYVELCVALWVGVRRMGSCILRVFVQNENRARARIYPSEPPARGVATVRGIPRVPRRAERRTRNWLALHVATAARSSERDEIAAASIHVLVRSQAEIRRARIESVSLGSAREMGAKRAGTGGGRNANRTTLRALCPRPDRDEF